MKDYLLHTLSPGAFEELVVRIQLRVPAQSATVVPV